MPASPVREALENVVHEHAFESAFLWSLRTERRLAAGLGLEELERLDSRLMGHLDGLQVAGESAWRICRARLISEAPGEMFSAMVVAIELGDSHRIDALLALAEVAVAMAPGCVGATGWIAAEQRAGLVEALLRSSSPFRRRLALTSCAEHRFDPGPRALERAAQSNDAGERAAALRAMGELGRTDLLPCCQEHLRASDRGCRAAAARASVLLGDAHAIGVLCEGLDGASSDNDTLELCLVALPREDGRNLDDQLLDPPTAIRAAGVLGEADLLEPLIALLDVPELSRTAGEAFSLITGLDMRSIEREHLDFAPEQWGPSDDPSDARVSLEDSHDLPWPDPGKAQRWWRANAHRFAGGERYLLGRPVDDAQIWRTLHTGTQRQRRLTALHLALRHPGRCTFATDAPAADQRLWLAAGLDAWLGADESRPPARSLRAMPRE